MGNFMPASKRHARNCTACDHFDQDHRCHQLQEGMFAKGCAAHGHLRKVLQRVLMGPLHTIECVGVLGAGFCIHCRVLHAEPVTARVLTPHWHADLARQQDSLGSEFKPSTTINQVQYDIKVL